MGWLIGFVCYVFSVGLIFSILILKWMVCLVSGWLKLTVMELLLILWIMLGILLLFIVVKSMIVLIFGLFVFINLWWEKYWIRFGDGMLNVVFGFNEKVVLLFIFSFNRCCFSFLEREVLFRWNSVGLLLLWVDLVVVLLLSFSVKCIRMVLLFCIDLDM